MALEICTVLDKIHELDALLAEQGLMRTNDVDIKYIGSDYPMGFEITIGCADLVDDSD